MSRTTRFATISLPATLTHWVALLILGLSMSMIITGCASPPAAKLSLAVETTWKPIGEPVSPSPLGHPMGMGDRYGEPGVVAKVGMEWTWGGASKTEIKGKP